MTTLPIHSLTLYKQGIGYYTRQGSISGATLSLIVPRETTNDVLKSLEIVINHGGPVLSVDYETPENKASVLDDLAVKIENRSSLVDLLTSLRGSNITLQRINQEPLTGRIVGVETSLDRPTLVLQATTLVQIVPLTDIQSWIMHDDRTIQDVVFFLDISQTEHARTSLTIRLPEGDHELSVRYLAPSPTWRVSYRLVQDSAGTHLSGWGLFDNDNARHYDLFAYRAGPLGDLKVSGSYFMPVTMGNAEPEFLTYRVATPVSVKRGQSALVPLFDTVVESQFLCVYNEAKMANHPLLVWRIHNTTGVALEQGPVTLTDNGRYLGEGLMRFTGVGDQVELPYALEFGILITHEATQQASQPWGISFITANKQVEIHLSIITVHTYTLKSHITKPMKIQIERRNPPYREYVDMEPPTSVEQDHSRWEVSVPGNASVQFTIREREISVKHSSIENLEADIIEQFHHSGLLKVNQQQAFQNLAEIRAKVSDTQTVIGEFQTERAQLLTHQEQLRKNLGALGTSEREQELRGRFLDDLERSEERRSVIDTALLQLGQQLKTNALQREAIIEQLLAGEN